MKRIHIASLILFVAAAAWMRGHWQWLAAQRALSENRAALEALQNRIDADQAALDSARSDQEQQNSARSRLAVELAEARRKLAKADPASLWAMPPDSAPNWNRKSPYIWLRKDALASLHLPALNWRGTLSRDTAELLGLDEASRVKLNQQVQGVLDQFYSLQNSNAVVTNTVPGGETADGPVVTLEIPALVEAGQALQNQITQILEENLGSERAGVMTNAAADWLNGFAAQEPDVYSVVQHPNGTYRVYSKSASGSFTSDGTAARGAYNDIPQNLASFFSDILPPPSDGQ